MIVSSETIFSTLLSLDFLSLPNAGLWRFTSFRARRFWPICFRTCHPEYALERMTLQARGHADATHSSYLKDASEGSGAQVVQYGVTADGFKGRSVLVHSLNALSKAVKLFFLRYETRNTLSICKVKNSHCQSTLFSFHLFVFLFILQPKTS